LRARVTANAPRTTPACNNQTLGVDEGGMTARFAGGMAVVCGCFTLFEFLGFASTETSGLVLSGLGLVGLIGFTIVWVVLYTREAPAAAVQESAPSLADPAEAAVAASRAGVWATGALACAALFGWQTFAGGVRIAPSNVLLLAMVACAVLTIRSTREAQGGAEDTQVVARTASRVALIAVITVFLAPFLLVALALLAFALLGGGSDFNVVF